MDKRILFTKTKFTITPSTNGGPGTLEGYALVWNQPSTDRGGYKVQLAPNSANFLNPTFGLANHDYSTPLARNDNNSLMLASDNYGVKATIQLPNTSHGRDVAQQVTDGLVDGMSFGMLDENSEFTTFTNDQNDEIDLYTKFDCDEVSTTPIPSFTGTTLGLKGPSPFAVDRAKRCFDRINKELGPERAKLEMHRLNLYPAALAEIQS